MNRPGPLSGQAALAAAVWGLLVAASSPAAAGPPESVEVFGYFEPEVSAAAVDGEMMQMYSNKLRIDLQAEVSDRVRFRGNFDYITYHGRTVCYLTDYLAESIVSDLPVDAREDYVFEFTDRNFLDNAYLAISFDNLDLTIGRLQISPGTGYAWNPTDMYNIKDILDPTYERPGHDAVRADIPLGNLGTAGLLYEPGDDFERSGKFARIKLHAGHFDVSLSGGERFVPLSDYLSGIVTDERRRMAGGDFAGQLLGLGVWGEFAYNWMAQSGDYFEGLLGSDYTFRNGFYVLNELYLNGQGEADRHDYDLNDWIRFLTSERKTVCRSQWFLYASMPATDLLTVGGSVITSLTDGSLVLVPSVEYNLSTNLNVTFLGNVYIGEEGKAYSSKLGQGGVLRLRYFF